MSRRSWIARPDINITPLIDILLVLLVIFLATLPLSEQSLDTNVPAAAQSGDAAPPPTQIVVECTADGRLSINTEPVALEELGTKLRGIYDGRRDKTLYILGAPSLRYAAIINVIDVAKGAGVERVGVITERMRRL